MAPAGFNFAIWHLAVGSFDRSSKLTEEHATSKDIPMTAALADLKAQLRRLEVQRSAIEAEIAQRSARLEAAGVGMQAPLIDDEVNSDARWRWRWRGSEAVVECALLPLARLQTWRRSPCRSLESFLPRTCIPCAGLPEGRHRRGGHPSRPACHHQ